MVRVKFSLGVRVSGMIRVRVDVRVRVRVSNLLVSEYGQCEFLLLLLLLLPILCRAASSAALSHTDLTDLTLPLTLNHNPQN